MTTSGSRAPAGAMLLYGNAGPGGSLERLSGDLLQEAHCLAASPAAPSELQAVKKARAPPLSPPPPPAPGWRQAFKTRRRTGPPGDG